MRFLGHHDLGELCASKSCTVQPPVLVSSNVLEIGFLNYSDTGLSSERVQPDRLVNLIIP